MSLIVFINCYFVSRSSMCFLYTNINTVATIIKIIYVMFLKIVSFIFDFCFMGSVAIVVTIPWWLVDGISNCPSFLATIIFFFFSVVLVYVDLFQKELIIVPILHALINYFTLLLKVCFTLICG